MLKENPEKRPSARFEHKSKITLESFEVGVIQEARMLNYSQTGACFESSEALINGATIMVRLEGYPAECGSECKLGDDCPWPRLVSLGEVKWCRHFPEAALQRFGVGVKFHLPV